MINKRLVGAVPGSGKYIAGNVVCQWLAMAANMVMIFVMGSLLQALLEGRADASYAAAMAAAGAAALVVRFICLRLAAIMSHNASRQVKTKLRKQLFEKLLALGPSFQEQAGTAQVVQVTVEGVDQLETYFGSYMPQFFYAMLAPLTLFAVLAFVSLKCAVVLLICVPLIPVAIALVQTLAKKLLSKYWGKYTELGDTFLENLQGLTTLKIYQADEARQEQMAAQSEEFRKVTMKVLTMQLNSTMIMDLVAYGGAALGAILAVTELAAGRIEFAGCFAVILLAADFFLPMRQLGSYFHVAMNGSAAADRMFALLDLEDPPAGTAQPDPENCGMQCSGLCFSYDGSRQILQDVSLTVEPGGLTAIVGESGCGKSTVARILTGRSRGYQGSAQLGGAELRDADTAAVLRNCTCVGLDAHLFRGSVRDNLLPACPAATDDALWSVLEQVSLAGFLRAGDGLDTVLTEGGGNLSGGQRQRLALARALLHNSPAYIFDEATSNIDVESETLIMDRILQLAADHTVLLISHRLANVAAARKIYVMENGRVVQEGTHAELLAAGGLYRRLWEEQQALEKFCQEAD